MLELLASEVVLVSIIGLVGVIITAVFGYAGIKMQRRKTLQAETELHFQSSALDFSGFVSEWSEVYTDLETLMMDSCIDRFLLLRAWNGANDPKWTTAVFQLRQGLQKPISYVHVTLDDDYIIKLHKTINNGSIYFSVDELQSSMIKEIYAAEGVKSSLWCFIGNREIAGHNGKAITYCSFSTHSDEEIPEEIQTRCKLIANRLRGLSLSFYDTL